MFSLIFLVIILLALHSAINGSSEIIEEDVSSIALHLKAILDTSPSKASEALEIIQKVQIQPLPYEIQVQYSRVLVIPKFSKLKFQSSFIISIGFTQ